MVDFKKLRASKLQPTITEPIKIFRRLPKLLGINDLYTSQAQVLEEWYKRRNERELVINLHTGGGKTLIGFLIAQSTLDGTREPVIYLAPTVQLVRQTLEKAGDYSITAVAYEKGADLPGEFLARTFFLNAPVIGQSGRSRGRCSFSGGRLFEHSQNLAAAGPCHPG
jgi:replicative superfamily II helicase